MPDGGQIIFVQDASGESIGIDLDPGASVADLIAAYQQAKGEHTYYKLFFSGSELAPDELLADVGVGNESSVQAQIRPELAVTVFAEMERQTPIASSGADPYLEIQSFVFGLERIYHEMLPRVQDHPITDIRQFINPIESEETGFQARMRLLDGLCRRHWSKLGDDLQIREEFKRKTIGEAVNDVKQAYLKMKPIRETSELVHREGRTRENSVQIESADRARLLLREGTERFRRFNWVPDPETLSDIHEAQAIVYDAEAGGKLMKLPEEKGTARMAIDDFSKAYMEGDEERLKQITGRLRELFPLEREGRKWWLFKSAPQVDLRAQRIIEIVDKAQRHLGEVLSQQSEHTSQIPSL